MAKTRKVEISSSKARTSISTETGIKAAESVKKIADEARIDFAIGGGLAMHIYGFTRATVDVDLIAGAPLPVASVKELSFGGKGYLIKVGRRNVPVDVIVRSDELTKVYRCALDDAVETDIGLKIVSPEWLLILKFFAGRAKDKLDLLWLLQENGLVDRKQVKKNLIKAIGKQSAFFVWQEFESEFNYADLLKLNERSKYK